MASNDNDDLGIEDISPSYSPGEQSSDDESDSSPRPARRRIAHKEMRNITDEKEEKETVPVATDSIPNLLQPIALENNNEEEGNPDNLPLDTAEEKATVDNAKDNMKTNQALSQSSDFEDISDEGEENEAFSPTEDDNENGNSQNIRTPESKNSLSDGDSDLEKDDKKQVELGNNSGLEEREKSHNLTASDMNNKQDVDDDYIDAPVPSPFSDIGDITGPEHAIISDILKETGEGNHISPELEGFATHLENSEEPVKMPAEDDQNKKNENLEAEESSDIELDTSPKDTHNDSQETASTDSKKEAVPEQGGSDVGGLIADIFGESDEEEEEFEGFGEEELYPERTKTKSRAIISDDEDDEDEQHPLKVIPEEKEDVSKEIGRVPSPEEESSDDDEKPPHREEMISDFDLMMQKKKEAMRQRRRTKRDFDIINDNDDIIAAMIRKMKDAAEEDRMLNQAGRAATKKMKLLDSVVAHLNKSDLQHTFIDCGILPVMKEWLSPLPDHSLPHLMIRKQFLKILSEFPALDKGALKMSGIGRAVMLLFKHPKETRQNRNAAGKIVSHWARPIFGVQTNFRDMTKEEREERDKMNVPTFKKRRLSSVDDNPSAGSSINSALQEEKRPRRPGDKGFIGRARVPRPSNKDYIVRPESNIAYADMGGMGQKSTKKSLNRFEKQVRKYQERKATRGNSSRAVSMSINGSKLAL